MPKCGVVRTSAEFESCPDSERPKGTETNTSSMQLMRHINNRTIQNDEDFLPSLRVVADTAIRLNIIPDRCPKGATPTEITQSYMDSIKSIEHMLEQFPTNNLLIEECQISFIFFLIGCSVEALAHWRKILNLLANSQSSVEKYMEIYKRYLDILQYQLPELPEEMMQPTAFNTVFKDVQRLVANCSLGGLNSEANYLAINLTAAIAWPFDDIFEEDAEDQPVIVET